MRNIPLNIEVIGDKLAIYTAENLDLELATGQKARLNFNLDNSKCRPAGITLAWRGSGDVIVDRTEENEEGGYTVWLKELDDGPAFGEFDIGFNIKHTRMNQIRNFLATLISP